MKICFCMCFVALSPDEKILKPAGYFCLLISSLRFWLFGSPSGDYSRGHILTPRFCLFPSGKSQEFYNNRVQHHFWVCSTFNVQMSRGYKFHALLTSLLCSHSNHKQVVLPHIVLLSKIFVILRTTLYSSIQIQNQNDQVHATKNFTLFQDFFLSVWGVKMISSICPFSILFTPGQYKLSKAAVPT